MNRATLYLLSLGLTATLAARTPAQDTLLPPRDVIILVSPGKTVADEAIEIAEASVHTRLVGPLAETTVTLVFHNPNDRPMEGELSYPLPPDATLQGYALDVNGKMVDGVPVPRQKARVAFEEEQRRGIDPGLAEWSGGNRFKTRISPIPARGQRTIRLRYTSLVQQNGATTSYRLPLDFEKVGTFRLRVEAVTDIQPQVQASGLGNLSFTPWQNHFVLEQEWKELALREDLVIDLPQGMAEAPAVEKQGDAFYLAKLLPLPQAGGATLPKVPRVDLIWDCSASMEKVDKEPILEALRLYVASNPDCLVRLTCVRDTVAPASEWVIENGDASRLLEALKSTHYDGATADMPPLCAGDDSLCLLVTDANVNFADKASSTPAKGPVYALVASSGTDMAALRRWGAVPIDLLRQTPQQALANIPAWQLVGVELDGKPWAEALTNAPGGVVDEHLLLTGTLPAGRHEVTIILRSPAGEQRVSFPVDTADALEGGLNRFLHAQNKLAALLLEPESPAREQQLRQLGEQYGIVTPGTSLLVLENLEQYLRHEVRPPACCPELRAQYDASISTRARQNALEQEADLRHQTADALRRREQLQDWYETDFSREKLWRKPGSPGSTPRERSRRSFLRALVGFFLGDNDVQMAASEPPPQYLSYVPAAEEEFPRLSAAVVEEDEAMVAEGAADEEGESAPAPVPTTVNRSSRAAAAPAPVAPASDTPPQAASIRVQAWSPDAPYLAVLAAAPDAIAAYYQQRERYADSPGFFLDCAEFFEKAGQRAMAVQVLSNLLEMDWENRSLMRAAAYRLRYMGEVDKAILLFTKVAELFPEEPQSHRDLALACADAGRWQEAVNALRRVLEQKMDSRFHGMEQVAAVELAHIVQRAQQAGCPVNTEGIDAAWLRPIEADLRVVINWDTDMSDMDLWVTDPRREKCYYGYSLTSSGGRISRDVLQGYGPEEFLIRRALPGDYKVQAHYYGTSSMRMLAPVTLYAELYTDYGRPAEKRQTLVFRLDERGHDVDIATISHRADPAAPTTRDYQVRAGDSWESIAEKELGSAARAADIISLNPGARADVPPTKGSIIRLPKH